jgi:hypothetical protein
MKMHGEVNGLIHVFLTSAQVGGEWSGSRPAALPLKKGPWYPLYGRLSGPQSQFGGSREEKILGYTMTLTPTPWSSSL